MPGTLSGLDEMYSIAVSPVGKPNRGTVPSAQATEPLMMTPATVRTLLELGWTLQGRTLTPHTRAET